MHYHKKMDLARLIVDEAEKLHKRDQVRVAVKLSHHHKCVYKSSEQVNVFKDNDNKTILKYQDINFCSNNEGAVLKSILCSMVYDLLKAFTVTGEGNVFTPNDDTFVFLLVCDDRVIIHMVYDLKTRISIWNIWNSVENEMLELFTNLCQTASCVVVTK